MVFLNFSEFEIINAFIKVFNSDFITTDKIPLNFNSKRSRERRRKRGSMENRIHVETIEGNYSYNSWAKLTVSLSLKDLQSGPPVTKGLTAGSTYRHYS